MSRDTKNFIRKFIIHKLHWALYDSKREIYPSSEVYCEYRATVPASGISIFMDGKDLTFKPGQNLYLYIPRSSAPIADVDLNSKKMFFVGDTLHLYPKSIMYEDGITWNYYANGNYNVIYRTTLEKPLIIGDVTYPAGSELVYRMMLPKDQDQDSESDQSEIDTNHPERTVRLFNEKREKMAHADLYQPASVYSKGSIAPFLSAENLTIPEIRRAILDDFVRTGRVTMDGIAPGNYKRLPRSQQSVCVDPAFSIRSSSPDSLEFFRTHKDLYNEWFKANTKKFGAPVEMTKALLYLEFINKQLSFDHRRATLLEHDPLAVSLFALAYDNELGLKPDVIQHYFSHENLQQTPKRAASLLGINTAYSSLFLRYLQDSTDTDVSTMIKNIYKIQDESQNNQSISRDFLEIFRREPTLKMTSLTIDVILKLKQLGMSNLSVVSWVTVLQRDILRTEIKNINSIWVALVLLMTGKMEIYSVLEFINNAHHRAIIEPDTFDINFVMDQIKETRQKALLIWKEFIAYGYSNFIACAAAMTSQLVRKYDYLVGGDFPVAETALDLVRYTQSDEVLHYLVQHCDISSDKIKEGARDHLARKTLMRFGLFNSTKPVIVFDPAFSAHVLSHR